MYKCIDIFERGHEKEKNWLKHSKNYLRVCLSQNVRGNFKTLNVQPDSLAIYNEPMMKFLLDSTDYILCCLMHTTDANSWEWARVWLTGYFSLSLSLSISAACQGLHAQKSAPSRYASRIPTWITGAPRAHIVCVVSRDGSMFIINDGSSDVIGYSVYHPPNQQSVWRMFVCKLYILFSSCLICPRMLNHVSSHY